MYLPFHFLYFLYQLHNQGQHMYLPFHFLYPASQPGATHVFTISLFVPSFTTRGNTCIYHFTFCTQLHNQGQHMYLPFHFLYPASQPGATHVFTISLFVPSFTTRATHVITISLFVPSCKTWGNTCIYHFTFCTQLHNQGQHMYLPFHFLYPASQPGATHVFTFHFLYPAAKPGETHVFTISLFVPSCKTWGNTCIYHFTFCTQLHNQGQHMYLPFHFFKIILYYMFLFFFAIYFCNHLVIKLLQL